MCEFISFVSDGRDFYAIKKEERRKHNYWIGSDGPDGFQPDSHSYLAERFKLNVDKINKYEFDFVAGKFTIDQLNIEDDAASAERWIKEKSIEDFIDLMAAVRQNGYALQYVPLALKAEIEKQVKGK